MDGGHPVMTTSTGAPVGDNQNSQTAGPYGPVVITDFHLLDKLAHFDRERIPERVVHAKGAGAHGYFEVTHDITKYCKARLFSSMGKRTPVFVRFSTVGGEKGSADTARDPRGFAIKLYTEDGNWDLVANNTPVFFVRDPLKFPDFIHTQKRHPQTNLPDADMFWDFLSLSPESIHQVTILFSDRGTPDGYRHMNGYSSHSFKTVNAAGEVFYVKFHLKTNQGIKNLTAKRAHQLASTDPDYATRDLFNFIDAGNYPSWTLCVQVMPVKAAESYRYNVLDVTKVWPHHDYPLQPVGRLVLDRNPSNYFQEVEQAAFSPGHLVPGIEASEDKMLQGRLFSYPDTHRHRLGANYDQIPVNVPRMCPFLQALHIRDGPMCVSGNYGGAPNYEPNSIRGAPKENPQARPSATPLSGVVAHHPQNHPNDDFEQAGALYRKVMCPADRDALISNIAGHLKNARKEIQERQVKLFARADREYGARVAHALGLPDSVCDSARM
ncbi:peroxisomal catalase [Cyclospora cayetanensis]|uniref:Catalase n=1 Tax=Cyclospora cayetanensis TaxID=88456 RepID=A0A6P6S3V3_9EIME|nr:peroxisomal catalase [Cyclospora cayetanensis]